MRAVQLKFQLKIKPMILFMGTGGQGDQGSRRQREEDSQTWRAQVLPDALPSLQLTLNHSCMGQNPRTSAKDKRTGLRRAQPPATRETECATEVCPRHLPAEINTAMETSLYNITFTCIHVKDTIRITRRTKRSKPICKS